MSKIIVGLLLASLLSAQAPVPTFATDVTQDQIATTLKKATATDNQLRVVDIGAYNVAVGVAHRVERGRPQGAVSHDQITEIYYIKEGSGTLVTGGTMVEEKRSAPDSAIYKVLNGPSSTGSGLKGGISRKVNVGDVIIIPPKVGHWFTEMDGDHIDYLIVRVDPDHVLPAGFVAK